MRDLDRRSRIVLKGPLPGQQLEEDNTEGVQVAAHIAALPADLFGAHVKRCSEALTRARQTVRNVCDLGDPEVQDLDPSRGVQVHVGGLQIAMHDPLCLRKGERLRRLGDHARCRRWRKPTLTLQVAGQIFPAYKLHHEVVEAVALADIEDCNDVGMAGKRRRRGRLLPKARHNAGILCQMIRQDLDREQAPVQAMTRQQHLGHTAPANPAKHFVL